MEFSLQCVQAAIKLYYALLRRKGTQTLNILLHFLHLTSQHVSINVKISYLWTFDLYGPVRNAFDAGNSIMRASGRGLSPGNRDFFGLFEMHRAVRRVPFGAQKSRDLSM
jgi:hypothetical protein